MFVLVLFTDEVLFICTPKDISAYSTRCPSVRYKDGRRYTARIIGVHENRKELVEIQKSLSSDEYPVKLQDLKLTNKRLPLSKILRNSKGCQDVSKIYLDPSVVPSPEESSENFILSFQAKKRMKMYFDKQPDLIEIEMKPADVPNQDIQKLKKERKRQAPIDNKNTTNDVSKKETLCNKDAPNLRNEKSTLSKPVHASSDKSIDEKRFGHEDSSKTVSPIANETFLVEISANNPIVDNTISNKNNSGILVIEEVEATVSSSEEPTKCQIKKHRPDMSSEHVPIILHNVESDRVMNPTQQNKVDNEFDENCNCITRSEGQVAYFQDDAKAIVKKPLIKAKAKSTACEEKGTEMVTGIKKPTPKKSNLQAISPEPHGDCNFEVSVEVHQQVPDKSDDALEINHCLDFLNPDRNEYGYGKKWDNAANTEISSDENIFDTIFNGDCHVPENISNETSLPTTLLPPILSSTVLDSAMINSELLDMSCFTAEERIAGEEKDEDSISENEPSDEEYRPSSPENSDDSTDVIRRGDINEALDHSGNRKKKDRSTLDITQSSNKPGFSAPDDANLNVQHSKTSAAYSKYHFCVYCQKLQFKIARHLETVHRKEQDVMEFAALEVGSKQRLELIAKIRKAGDNLYNTDSRFNRGNLLVVRRPQQKMLKNATDYIACAKCKGQYSKSVIRHHWRKCGNKCKGNERVIMLKGRMISGRIHEKANAIVRNQIFPYMREDDVVRGIRYDELIILYANKQTEKYGMHPHQYQMIRARLRLLGRLLLEMKSINPTITNFADIFVPRLYDDTINAVKVIAGMDEKTRTFKHPAVASNIGTLLKHVGELLRSEYIKFERAHDQKRVEDFLKLQAEDYTTSINRAVTETQMQQNRRKKVVLPSVEDITKLHNWLKSERDRHFETLQQAFSKDSWQQLAETSLVSLQLFNRRRPGEIERVYLEDFDSYQCIDRQTDKEIYEGLTSEGQALARKYVRFMIRGKRGRGVPVLVPSDIFVCLTLIKKHRKDAGVSANNPYLFGMPSIDEERSKYLRACDLMRSYAVQCGAAVPSTLRGTQLRKHIATKCINLNLSQNQVSDLANFMGHHENIHKQIYRQPVIENDIVKISKLLEIALGTHQSNGNHDESSSSEEEACVTTGKAANRTTQLMAGHGNSFYGDSEEFGRPDTSTGSRNKNESGNSVSINRGTHRRWSLRERDVALSAFETMLLSGNMPSGEQMQKLINENECLRGRAVPQFRTWLHTQKKKLGL